ncbi:mechanosensitive ion channel family protein [Lederbergia graminis]|uniref:Mechanosensitive ion channel family protein n=1 Tax=Lederbergia graminis TaxID=735518 RepID=A0ABW0LK54_9BACI
MFDWKKFDWEGLLVHAGIIALKIIGILIVFAIVKRIGSTMINRVFTRLASRNEITKSRAITLHKLAENVLSYVLIFTLVATIFGVLGLPIGSLIAGAGIVGLAIGFGAQGLVSDVVTGFFLLLEKQIEVNEYVTIGSIDGVVESVGLRTTQIRGFDGTLHFIPNREIISVSNHSRGTMRALVDIRISYDDDIDQAIRIIQSACDRVAAQNSDVIVDGPNVIGVQALGTSEVVLRVIAKTKNNEQWGVERELRKTIKEEFDLQGIKMPFPHQVLVQQNSTNS